MQQENVKTRTQFSLTTSTFNKIARYNGSDYKTGGRALIL